MKAKYLEVYGARWQIDDLTGKRRDRLAKLIERVGVILLCWRAGCVKALCF